MNVEVHFISDQVQLQESLSSYICMYKLSEENKLKRLLWFLYVIKKDCYIDIVR